MLAFYCLSVIIQGCNRVGLGEGEKGGSYGGEGKDSYSGWTEGGPKVSVTNLSLFAFLDVNHMQIS